MSDESERFDAKKPGFSTERSALLAGAGFVHGFSTRRGGKSVAPYDAMDFALLRDRETLAWNIALFARAVGFDESRLYQAQQVHGARVFVPREGGDDALGTTPREGDARYAEADALVASIAHDVVGVRVADCVPVLIADRETGRVAAVHAGWKGVVAGVVSRAIDALAGNPEDMIAAIGPCIGACCFEVSREVAEKIAHASTGASIVSAHAEDKAMVDLRAAVMAQLARRGIDATRAENVGGCTRCDAASYYSFRRDGDRAGRLLAVIAARSESAR